jgi:SAM-dependent methyltransferase
MGRFSFRHSRRTRAKLATFCREFATDEYTLVAFIVSKRQDRPAHLYTDTSFSDLGLIGSGSFGMIVCTGLLEHIADPHWLAAEFHRILKPGGRLVLSASAVFPFHGAPDDYFHFTPHGLRHLFRSWSRWDALRGSTTPFETIAVLLQRIDIQCEVFPPLRLLLVPLYYTVPLLDVFVRRQYDSGARDADRATDAFMPATLHAVVVK